MRRLRICNIDSGVKMEGDCETKFYHHEFGHNEQNGVQKCRRNINISAIHPLFVYCVQTLVLKMEFCNYHNIMLTKVGEF